MFRETLPAQNREQCSARDTFRQFAQVLRVKSFAAFLAIFSLFNLGFMAYISVASFVYERWFGLDEMGYGLFFAATALVTALGPFAWEFASRWMNARRFLWAELAFGLASGACLLAVGGLSPWTFCLAFIVFSVAKASVRPLSTTITLGMLAAVVGRALLLRSDLVVRGVND